MNNFPKQAMVLAAGLGKRMRPLTNHIPKPMLEIAGRTMVDRAIDHLEKIGVEQVVVNSSYKAEILEAHLKKRLTPTILFSYEEEPLETGGGIAKALHYFNQAPFFCINGDVIWLDGKAPALVNLAKHWSDDIDVLLLLHPTEKAIGYEGNGDFFMDEHHYLTRRKEGEIAPFIYTGIQILHPRIFDGAPKGAFSLNILYNQAIAAKRLKAIIHDGALLNVGDPQGKELAEKYLQDHVNE